MSKNKDAWKEPDIYALDKNLFSAMEEKRSTFKEPRLKDAYLYSWDNGSYLAPTHFGLSMVLLFSYFAVRYFDYFDLLDVHSTAHGLHVALLVFSLVFSGTSILVTFLEDEWEDPDDKNKLSTKLKNITNFISGQSGVQRKYDQEYVAEMKKYVDDTKEIDARIEGLQQKRLDKAARLNAEDIKHEYNAPPTKAFTRIPRAKTVIGQKINIHIRKQVDFIKSM